MFAFTVELDQFALEVVTAGIGLDAEQATLLRDALNEWLSGATTPQPT